MIKFWNFFVKRRSFSYLIVIALAFFGIAAVISIPKESAPEVQVPVGIVATVFPGAAAPDVEKLITNKIETALNNNLENLKKITSTSRESASIVVAEFEASADIDKSIRELKDEVDRVQSELPNNAEDSVVSEVNFVDQPIMIISITADVAAPRLIELADAAETALEQVRGVSRIDQNGVRKRETQVVVNKEQLAHFHLNLLDVVAAISRANSSLPIGTITQSEIDYALKFEGDIVDPNEVGDLTIAPPGGQPVYIRDIALVSDSIEKAVTLSRVSLNGAPAAQAISLLVFKRRGGDITKIAKNIRLKIEELKTGLLVDSKVLISFDAGELVEEDLFNLTRSGLQTIALVLVVLLIFLGWREALIASLAIPLSFLIGFIGLQASGNTINFVSLFALILSVGILVDSAIVMVEGIHTKMKRQLDKQESALSTIKEFNWPLAAGTATTIAVFAPLFFISGVTGQFIYSIPFTIIFVLIASFFVALGIVPVIAATFMRRRMTSRLEERQDELSHRLQSWYGRKLALIIGRRRRENIFFLGLTIAFLLAITLPVTGLVKTEFFPQEDIDFLYVEIEKPQGTVLAATDLGARAVEEVLYRDPRIDSLVTTIGASSSFSESTTDTKLANITINLRKDRQEKSSTILNDLRREISKIKTVEARILEPNNGPPTGAPILIQFFGDDFIEIEAAANRAADVLKSIPGTAAVTTSTKNSNTEFVLTINKAKASEIGLDAVTIAQTLRTAIYGTIATTIKKQTDDIDVVVKLNLNPDFRDTHETNQASIDAIRQITIETPRGPVILGSLIEISLQHGRAIIRHENLKRVTNVTGNLETGFTVGEIIKAFEEKQALLALPPSVLMKIGGETEDVQESFADLGRALVVGVLLIMAILILQFNSFRYSFYIVVIIPLSLIGIFLGLLLSGRAVSFPSIMGFIALSGIVVNNSIILIDAMNAMRIKAPEKTIQEIVIESAVSRLRPILLTTLTTVIGVIPLTFASELWAPLAYAIMFGLSFAVIITLLLVPIMYNRWPGKTK